MSEAEQEFSTTEKAPFIRIDGERYDLLLDRSAKESWQLERLRAEYLELLEKKPIKRTDNDIDRMVEIGDILMLACLEAPQEILDKLSTDQRQEIAKMVNKLAAKDEPDPTEAGDGSSPGSTDSTE